MEELVKALEMAMSLIPENEKPTHPSKDKTKAAWSDSDKKDYDRRYKRWKKNQKKLDHIHEVQQKYSSQILREGYLRIAGVERADNINMIIHGKKLEETALKLYAEYPDYDVTKCLWVEDPDGGETRLDDLVPYPSNK